MRQRQGNTWTPQWKQCNFQHYLQLSGWSFINKEKVGHICVYLCPHFQVALSCNCPERVFDEALQLRLKCPTEPIEPGWEVTESLFTAGRRAGNCAQVESLSHKKFWCTSHSICLQPIGECPSVCPVISMGNCTNSLLSPFESGNRKLLRQLMTDIWPFENVNLTSRTLPSVPIQVSMRTKSKLLCADAIYLHFLNHDGWCASFLYFLFRGGSSFHPVKSDDTYPISSVGALFLSQYYTRQHLLQLQNHFMLIPTYLYHHDLITLSILFYTCVHFKGQSSMWQESTECVLST